jgi:antitoxin component YwqK of YwqJK toxin-antitoxin module/ribosomal protein L31E
MKLLSIALCCLINVNMVNCAYSSNAHHAKDFGITFQNHVAHKLTFDSVRIEPKINRTLTEFSKSHLVKKIDGELFTGVLYDYYEIGEGPRYKTYTNNVESGFLSYIELQNLSKEGKLTKETLVWQGGMKNWEKVESIEELADLFNDSSKKVEFVGYFSNGRIDSLISYFANGMLSKKIIYYTLFADYIDYYSNGQVWKKGNIYYTHQQGMFEGGNYVGPGHMCGEYEYYHRNGKPYNTGKYINKKIGSYLYSEFTDNGQLKMTKEYTGTKRRNTDSEHGYSWDYLEKYYTNGVISKSYSYINGKHSEQLIAQNENHSTPEKNKSNKSSSVSVVEDAINGLSDSEKKYFNQLLKMNSDPQNKSGKVCGTKYTNCKWCNNRIAYHRRWQSSIETLQNLNNPLYAGLASITVLFSAALTGGDPVIETRKGIREIMAEIKAGKIYSCGDAGSPPSFCSKKCETENNFYRR